jgi:hypothetical protein
MTMDHYAGIDVSLEASSVCVVDASGKIVKEAKLPSEPGALITWFKALPFALARIGLEAGPLSQWLHAGLKQAGFAVELLETRHVREVSWPPQRINLLILIGPALMADGECCAMSNGGQGRDRKCSY